ncbi:Ig-like domain-containing protein [Paenibacillus filicis]|uniref:Ig-like domain-containing protein n=1 Tax=Paenibacillus filicis TaxID=669464 RepID=A0ABU9DEC4_9BACL
MSNGRLTSTLATLMAACLLVVFAGTGFTAGGTTAYAASSLNILQTVTGNIFYETDTKSFDIQTDGDEIDWAYTDYWGATVASGSQAVVNGETKLTVNPLRYGWFKLVVSAKQHGVVTSSKETSFAVVSNYDLSQIEDSKFSIQTHAARTDIIAQDSAALLPISAKLGVKYIRDSLRWEDIEDTSKGLYSFKSFHDDFMDRLAANHLKPYMTLALYNSLYDGGLVPASTEARMAFAEYGKQVLSRYPEIGQVEIWNEPDIPSFGKGLTTEEQKADFYFNLLKTSYEQLHPVFPDVKITGFVFGELGSDAFLESLYQKGALQYMDEYSFHSYTRNPEEIVKDIDRHKRIMKAYNHNQLIPINLSETGFTNFNFDEHVQANYTVRRIVTALTQDIQKINIYNLQNKTTVPNEYEGTFGLIRNPNDEKGAYVPKPAYAAYAALTRQLTGAQFQQTEEISPGLVYVHKFTQGNDTLRVMYAPAGAELKLHTTAGLLVTDMMGNSRMLPPVDGVVRVQLTKDPIYVKGSIAEIEDVIPVPTGPIALYNSYGVNGGYSEVNGTIGTATNKWVTSSVAKGYDGGGSRAITDPTGASAKWTPIIQAPGHYRITVYVPGQSSAPANTTRSASYSIYVNGIQTEVKTVNQWDNQGKWVELGVYPLSRGVNNYVIVEDSSSEPTKRPLRADVAKFEWIPPTGIALSQASVALGVGQSYALTATAVPADATERELVWSSSDSAVATVNEQGQVSAVGVGTAVIRATNPFASLYAEASVHVGLLPIIQPVAIYSSYGVNGGYTEINGTLGIATNKWVTSTVLQGYNGGISRAITNPTGASATWSPAISQPGRYQISVYLPGTPATPVYTTRAAQYSIYVDGVLTDSKILDTSALQGTWQALGFYDLPQGSNTYVTVKDANPAHDRPLRADAAKFELIPVTGISLGTASLDLQVGDSHRFTVSIAPNDATDQTLIWTSSNNSVAALDAQGQLQALAAGSTVIRATNPLTSLYAEVQVTVQELAP